MTYFEQWKAISSRIRGLVQAGELREKHLSTEYLKTRCNNVLSALKTFQDEFQDNLSPQVLKEIEEFVSEYDSCLKSINNNLKRGDALGALLVILSIFETEMTFLLSDAQIPIRSRTERAFSHLKRSIVVDPEIRQKWCTAFKEGETTLEKFGAVHLLLHGIWAFKVTAEGERTDLVYNEPAGDLAKEQSFADGLVLTEWKKANTDKEALERYEQARSQMSRYQHGALGGMELTGYRYAIIVTQKHLKPPLAEFCEGSVIYRPINIVVDPDVPSKG